MRRFRSTHSVGRYASRLTVVAGLVGFLVANTGLPVVRPVAPRGKDKSKPFLCQDRPCGCMSADECLRGCCCFTARQRLAWAKENNIEPPAELIAAADREGAPRDTHSHAHADELAGHHHDADNDDGGCVHGESDHDANIHEPAGTKCCGRSAARVVSPAACGKCDHAGTLASEACHVGHHTEHDDSDKTEQSDEHGWRITFIMGPLAGHCRGLGPLSVLTFSALPASATVSYCFDWSCAGEVETYELRIESVHFPPPTRPPCA